MTERTSQNFVRARPVFHSALLLISHPDLSTLWLLSPSWRDKPLLAETSSRTDRRTPIITLLRLVDDIVDDSVFLGLLRVHDEVALYILFYLVQLLPAMFRK